MPTPWDLPPRMRTKVRVSAATGCWLWTGARTLGYGRIKYGQRIALAHRVIYELLQAEIPEGMQLDHLCWVRRCVNPDHLEPVTQRENIRRGLAEVHDLATYPCGHPRTEENTITQRRPPGVTDGRICRECQAVYKRRYRARKRAAA